MSGVKRPRSSGWDSRAPDLQHHGGRPRTTGSSSWPAVRLDPALHVQLRELADARGVPMSTVLAELLRAQLGAA